MLHRIIIAAIMLGTASYLDVRSREVQDKFWVPFFAVGAALTVYDFYISTSGFGTIELLFAVGMTSGLAWATYFLRLFGGADAKAITTLSVIFPIYDKGASFHIFGALMSFTNSVLLTVLLPIGLFIVNMLKILRGEKVFHGFEEESKLSKLKALFLGYRKTRAGQYDFSMEQLIDGKRRFHFSLGKIDEDFAKGSDIWVTPGIPLLVFVLLGFIATLLVGDLMFLILSAVFDLLV